MPQKNKHPDKDIDRHCMEQWDFVVVQKILEN